ncbi:hypothetical protein [Brevundimonas subvibrioides]|uniref:Acyl-CoA transferase n=1 Tax=Brevundimonas subvibrioides (strain ATCC 15264 / DSM 4735 / LMG 14903 / NBRC 16000 / CB 81) TaxID=633149 RepID=D9QI87_BRESC|nr:hypothetical protein [Brevundimonas subvibrioides]ADK99389.1 conserved hypothetical protein [Brevundimonas subvibrioides ATCC 15264]
MASLREQVIEAVVALLQTAVPTAEVKRNVDAPDRAPTGGLIVVRDGDPGEPEQTFSPLTYTYTHAIGVEVVAPADPDARSAALDAILIGIGNAVEADRTLGGLAEWLEPTSPDLGDARATNAQPVRWATFDLNAVYSTRNPLV